MKQYEFSKFLLSGGIAAGVNFLSRYELSHVMSYASSIVIAYLIGMLTAYAFCRLFVFESKKHSTIQQLGYFTVVNLFAIAQTLGVSLLFADYFFTGISNLNLRESLAHLIGIGVPVFTSYYGHKYVTFR